MKTRRRHGAFTRIELLIVGTIIAVMVLLILVHEASHARMHARLRARVDYVQCVSNLKQIGVGLRMWANDHQEKFPWQVSTNEGGTFEFLETADVWRHFQAASNELVTPKILVCPADTDRIRTTNWILLNNSNLSYFLCLDIDSSIQQRLLAGDRFLGISDQTRPPRQAHTGNVAFSDGSVGQLSPAGLREALSNRSIRLSIP